MEALAIEEAGDELQNTDLWAELMHELAYTVGDVKHTVEVQMVPAGHISISELSCSCFLLIWILCNCFVFFVNILSGISQHVWAASVGQMWRTLTSGPKIETHQLDK